MGGAGAGMDAGAGAGVPDCGAWVLLVFSGIRCILFCKITAPPGIV